MFVVVVEDLYGKCVWRAPSLPVSNRNTYSTSIYTCSLDLTINFYKNLGRTASMVGSRDLGPKFIQLFPLIGRTSFQATTRRRKPLEQDERAR